MYNRRNPAKLSEVKDLLAKYKARSKSIKAASLHFSNLPTLSAATIVTRFSSHVRARRENFIALSVKNMAKSQSSRPSHLLGMPALWLPEPTSL